MIRHDVVIYVDGAALPSNPGRGGAGVVLLHIDTNGVQHKRCFGRYLGENVTNNVAEIHSAIEALAALKYPCNVTLFSDAQYVVKTMTDGWRRNTNHHLWNYLDDLAGKHNVTWRWVKGHAGDEYNELAHRYAEEAAKTMEDVNDALE